MVIDVVTPPTVKSIFPFSSSEVVVANPSEMMFVSVARLLTVRGNVPDDAELVVVISTTLLPSVTLLFENSPLFTVNRRSVFRVDTTLLNVCSFF